MDCCGLICIRFFPLHGEYLKEMRKQLMIMHKQKSDLGKIL
jgi:hypothetical protein